MGAVGIFKDATLTNVTFTGNKSTEAEDSEAAGALFLGAVAKTVISSNTFENNESAASGGAINTRSYDVANNSGATLDITGSTFTGNKATDKGGAINNFFYNSNTAEGYVYVGDSKFEGNSATNGGAIYNHGESDKAGNSAAMIIENSTFTANTALENGGAIYNASTMTINNSVFSGNTAAGEGNDIYNAGELTFGSGTTTLEGGIDGEGNTTVEEEATLENKEGSKINQTLITNKGIIENEGTIESVNAIENSGLITSNADNIIAEMNNSGIYNVTGGTISYKVTGTNGIINVRDDEVTVSTTVTGNNVNLGTTLKLEKDTYLDGSTLTIEDGAILITQNEETTDMSGMGVTIAEGANWTYRFDVDVDAETADLLKIVSGQDTGTLTLDNIKFLTDGKAEVSVEIADQKINVITINPDIYTTNIRYKVSVDEEQTEGTWLKIVADGYGGLPNAVHDGAAVYNVTEDVDKVTAWINGHNYLINDLVINGNDMIIKGSPESGTIEGIIVSEDTKLTINDLEGFRNFEHAITVNAGGELEISTVTFKGNKVTSEVGDGAAIYNSGTATIKDSAFVNNEINNNDGYGGAIFSNGTLTVDNVEFKNNKLQEDGDTYGGAVYIGKGGTATITNSTFEGNYADRSGALATGTKSINVEITSTTFKDNTSKVQGAVGIFNAGQLNNVTFENNRSTEEDTTEGAGALFVGAEGKVEVTSSTFKNNVSASDGGAIGTRAAEDANNSAAKLDVTGSIFTGNQAAGNGGAINNYLYNSNTQDGYVYVGDSKFEGNDAANGGAIYNSGETDKAGNIAKMYIENSTFTANTASENGGAIYNAGTMIINNSEFSGNTADGDGNDIYNVGDLSFSSGTITMEGGIAGEGKTTVGEEATLINKEESTISQKEINIYGTIMNNNETDNAIISDDMLIEENGSVTTNASALSVTNGIVNRGTMTFTGGKNMNAIDSEFDGYGRIEIAGDVENAAEIYQETVVVTSGKLTNDADTNIITTYLTNNTEIVNNGTISPTNMTNESNALIDNAGEIHAYYMTNKTNATINNKENGTIDTSTMINETSGTINNESDFNVSALFESSGTVTNSGTITSGALTNYESGIINNEGNGTIYATDLENKGIMNNGSGAEIGAAQLTNSGTIISSGTIDPLTIINETNGTINNEEGGKIIADSAFINNGTVVNKSSITARNNLTNNENGNITNSENAEINATLLTNKGTITNEGTIQSANYIVNSGTITSNANNIFAGVENSGEYNITGGTITYSITGTEGTINIRNNEVTVETTITGNTVNLGTLLNLKQEDYLTGSQLAIEDGATLNTINNSTAAVTTNAITVASGAKWNLQLDVDLAGESADNLINVTSVGENSQATINNLNILSDKAQLTSIQIADAYINAFTNPDVYTTNIRYKVTTREEDGKTYLDIEACGYGGLANAVYDGAQTYDITEGTDYLTAWIEDPIGTINNTLKGDLTINGNDKVLTSTTSVDGINTSTYTLTMNDLKEFSGFNNAVNVDEEDGALVASNVTFTNSTGDAVITNEGTVTLSSVTFSGNKTDIDIANNGELIIAGADQETVLEKGITGEGNTTINEGAMLTNGNNSMINQSSITVNGSLINENDTLEAITANDITIGEDGSLVTDASAVRSENAIDNSGMISFTGGTNYNEITGTGETNIAGDVINSASIKQSTVTISDDARLTTSADDIETTVGITNVGELVFTDGTNNNDITGEGNLTVTGDLTNNGDIEQALVSITSGVTENNGTIVTTGEGIEITKGSTLITHGELNTWENGGQITNDGTLNVNVLTSEGEADNVENKNDIIGNGDLIISSTNFVNEGTISQKTLTVADADSGFETDIANLTILDKITNEGEFTYTGEGTNKTEITGEGNLTIAGTIENSTGTAISQNAIAITSGNGFKTRADDITTTEGIENNGTLTFIGGTNNNEITMEEDGEGVLIVENDLTNQANIEQKEINITGGDFENVRTSSITADTITVADGSTLITDALDLDISDTITLSGEETVLNLKDEEAAEIETTITGAGKIVKEGEGTVTLSGENDYTGTTTISGGAIEILAADGISENTIYMDGGKLIVNGDEEVELGNEIMGTDHNDVNIEVAVAGSTTTMTGTIYGNEDLVKTGEGVLNLQMETNGYAGDTIISSGTVIGTTKNINGKVIGSGDEYSIVEFYDGEGEVTLNEFDTENYIGTFEKTGAATMTVIENFKALNANITNGTFIINNDAEMGGSGSTFEVTNEMRVENALLKGYGDIKTGDLIIGKDASLAPGNSTTTFKVDGNLIFEDNGNYDVEFGQFDMDSEGHYNDNTQVTGTTTIGEDATLTLNNLEGKYYVKETIDLINAGTLEDGYEYKEGNIVFNDNDARDLREGYDTRISTRVYTEGNALKLELQRKKSDYADSLEFTRSHNQQEAANAIDSISTGHDGEITNPLDAMEKMYYYESTYDIDGLKAALNDIAGVIHANSTMLTFTNAKIEHVYDKVQERTKDLLICDKAHDKIWAEYYYNTYNVKENENSPEFDTNVNGFLVGFDMISAKNLTLGIMGGYGTSELKEKKDKTTMNDINFGFYGGYETDKWLFKGMLLGGYEQYETTRTIGFMDEQRIANSEYNGYNAALDLELGYKIKLNKDEQAKHKMYLKPFIGITGSCIMNEGFEEKGADSLNLKVEDYNEMTAQARAGIGINGKLKKFGWYAKAGVRQYLTEDYNEIESSLLDYQDLTKMKIRSAELDKFSYGGGLGADYDLSENWNIFANGLASFADKSNNYYGNIGIIYKFGCANNKSKRENETKQYLQVVKNELKEKDEELSKMKKLSNEELQNKEQELINKEQELKNKEKEIQQKEQELNDAMNREKELQKRIDEYEAKVVSEQEAQKMKEKTIKNIKLKNKPTFIFGTDKLDKKGKESLKEVAKELENYPDADVLIEGHTDSVGSDSVNQKISEKRAAAIARTLNVEYGVKNNISVIGKGEKEPIASNETEAGRAQNRRVEIILTTAE
ncbi:MAG: autotransporter domain-containing protein [Elusimicrobia bacterium]|nr:autotransporter domain-containing protein [Elusimicrobiota bacterium]